MLLLWKDTPGVVNARAFGTTAAASMAAARAYLLVVLLDEVIF